MADNAEVEELVAQLRGRYLESVERKSDALVLLLCRFLAEQDNEHSWAHTILSNEGLSPSVAPSSAYVNLAGETCLAQATRMVHSMVGSGASYGLPGITTRARVIENALRVLPAESEDRLSTLIDTLNAALQLRAAIRGARRGEMTLFKEDE